MKIGVDWEVIGEAFEKHPQECHNLLMLFYDLIQANKAGEHRLITRTLFQGIKELYPKTREYKESFKLYYLFLSADLNPQFEMWNVLEQAWKSRREVEPD